MITLTIKTSRQGLHDITQTVNKALQESKTKDGLCTVFIQHTSASLIIQENADPTAKADLENWLNRLVQENDPLYSHTLEGADDMPAHIKASLTATSLSIPFYNQRLALGTWQGLYLWEHRHAGSNRRIIVHLSS